MNRLLTILAFAALLVSCNQQETPVTVDPEAVGFDAYVNRGVSTRAGHSGELTTTNIQTAGFGVFAYYGNGALYNETSKPDFMYNQEVTYNGTAWTYSPVKYWPNEFGAAASSEAADRLSFFAYAPFAEVTPSTGIVTATGEAAQTGIIGMSRNIAAGDPVVMYSASLIPGTGVDLCWGVSKEAFTSSVDGSNNNVEAGYPFINLLKTKTNDHIKFEFNHALAQLNVKVDAVSDAALDANTTRIFVRSITFNGFSLRGSLNLNSNKTDGAIWYDISGTGRLKREAVTIYDGRTDGMEGVATAADNGEKPASLNPVIVQSKPYGDAALAAGVTATAVNLFNNGSVDAPVMVIPTPGVPLSVTIVYDVETADEALSGYLSDGVTHGSSVENKITKKIQLTGGSDMILASGNKYVVNLHLGLTSVKFDASVATWSDDDYSGTASLPENTTSLGTVTITSGTDPLTSLTMWTGETMTSVPTVTVEDENHDPVTGFDVEWTSNNTGVATVAADGTVTPVAPGTATITVKATKDDRTSSKSYMMYVNELTGISITSSATSIALSSTLPVKATLQINGGNTVNGDITNNLPSVTWSSSASAKISVTTPTAVVNEGGAYVATNTATAESPAVIGDHADITASVGGFSDTVTLTCIDSRTVTGVTLGTSATTVWRHLGYTVPTSVTVQGTEDSDLTSLATISWKLDGNSVTLTNGAISIDTAGEHTVTVTASYNNSEASTNVTVYANEVTGISVAPATVTVQKGATTTLTATLTKTSYGTALANPTISWSSGSTSYVTVSPATGTSTTASGVAAGSSTVTASIPADYMQSGVANSASATVQCVTPSMTAFRGYEVSPGILMRTVDGTTVTYSLTDGTNPFEPAIYYNNSSLNQYFLEWNTLKNELGSDGSNIKADSDKLPTGWRMPTAGERDDANPLVTDWGRIIYGAPKSTITVGGTSVPNKAYVGVKVDLGLGNSYGVPQGTYYGMLLLRDGTNIPGYFTMGGTYDDNRLTETQFKELLEDYGCVFFSITGYYWSGWKYLSNREGYYWASNCSSSKGYYLGINYPDGGFRLNSTRNGSGFYYPVKLVKPVSDD